MLSEEIIKGLFRQFVNLFRNVRTASMPENNLCILIVEIAGGEYSVHHAYALNSKCSFERAENLSIEPSSIEGSDYMFAKQTSTQWINHTEPKLCQVLEDEYGDRLPSVDIFTSPPGLRDSVKNFKPTAAWKAAAAQAEAMDDDPEPMDLGDDLAPVVGIYLVTDLPPCGSCQTHTVQPLVKYCADNQITLVIYCSDGNFGTSNVWKKFHRSQHH